MLVDFHDVGGCVLQKLVECFCIDNIVAFSRDNQSQFLERGLINVVPRRNGCRFDDNRAWLHLV